LALFAKILKRIVNSLQEVRKLGAGRDIPTEEEATENVVNNSTGTFRPVEETVEEELRGEPSEEARQAKTIQRELLDSMDMSQ
jgi:N-acetyltransferase 10